MRAMFCMLALGLVATLARSADEPKPLLAEKGKLLFEDDLTKPLGEKWKTAKGKWEVVEGAIRGVEVKEDMHGAVTRAAFPFRDVVIRYDFKLDGAKQTSLSINQEKGHVCRVLIRPDALVVQKDDSDGKNGPDKAAVLQKRTIEIKPGWHTLQIELVGKEMVATLDGKDVAFGEHEFLDRPKANLGFTVAGESVSFRNLKVWEATRHKDWEKTKATLAK